MLVGDNNDDDDDDYETLNPNVLREEGPEETLATHTKIGAATSSRHFVFPYENAVWRIETARRDWLASIRELRALLERAHWHTCADDRRGALHVYAACHTRYLNACSVYLQSATEYFESVFGSEPCLQARDPYYNCQSRLDPTSSAATEAQGPDVCAGCNSCRSPALLVALYYVDAPRFSHRTPRFDADASLAAVSAALAVAWHDAGNNLGVRFSEAEPHASLSCYTLPRALRHGLQCNLDMCENLQVSLAATHKSMTRYRRKCAYHAHVHAQNLHACLFFFLLGERRPIAETAAPKTAATTNKLSEVAESADRRRGVSQLPLALVSLVADYVCGDYTHRRRRDSRVTSRVPLLHPRERQARKSASRH